MKTVDDLWEHIAYVMAYAPQFPYRDFLPASEQMTLDKAFEQLRQGVPIAYPQEEFASKRAADPFCGWCQTRPDARVKAASSMGRYGGLPARMGAVPWFGEKKSWGNAVLNPVLPGIYQR